ncbi:helix-turn-helix domain-containing protein [Gemmiger formicilis]|nr:helix-turn-helix domain-containing protein [Gemmiger formicilis]
MPPGKYMTNVRIEAVKTLLLTDEYNLDMIAGLTGFSGANYLCRVFKREVGLSPRPGAPPPHPCPPYPSSRREVRRCMCKERLPLGEAVSGSAR